MTTNEDKHKGKSNTGKKFSYVYDEIGYKLGGCYAFTPYDNIDRNGKTLVKVGFTVNFRNRFEDYYTSFTTGVYILNLLENPTIKPIPSRDDKKDTNKFYYIKRVFYLKVERFIMDEIIRLGGIRIKSTTRITNADEKGGETEWFYTKIEWVKQAFRNAKEMYDGRLYSPKQDIKKQAKEDLANKDKKFVGNIITFV
jgi:hypothetical protein